MSGRGPRGAPMERGGSRPYKVLCVSSLHPKASDDVVRDTLYREYKKYGDISVRVVLDPDGRVAYVYFRNFDDARDARHSKSRIILFDKPAVVEPVYESRSEAAAQSQSQSYSSSSRSRQRSITPPSYSSSSRYRSRSPPHYSDRGHSKSTYPSGGRGGRGSSSGYRGRGDRGEADYGGRDDYHHSSSHGGHGHRGGDYRDSHQGRSHGSSRDYDDHHGRGGRGRGRGRGRGGYDGGGRGRGGRGRDNHHGNDDDRFDRDGKKDKFPNYLEHIPPEDDPLATRTLFTGNLELNITDEEIKRIFGRYGNLLDIDIKRPPPGTGNAYAFIRYENLDMAHRAKVELSGQYIGKFQCKIGYGKVNATTKVWVGQLGSWCSRDLLWKEFDRFGAIKDIEYRTGDTQAHVYYENIDAAQAAVQEMRGHPLGGPDKRLRIDFADLDVVPGARRDYEHIDSKHTTNGRGGGHRRQGRDHDYRRGPPEDYESPRGRSQGGGRRTPESGEDYSPGRGGSGNGNGSREPGSRNDGHHNSSHLANVTDIVDMGHKTQKVWDGGLILKNSLFPTKLHIVEGAPEMAESLKDETGKPNLKITQRLRLDQSKLDDVTKRMTSTRSHAVFLGLPTTNAIMPDGNDVQSRPLRNLISYLKQKEAAGVISMTGGPETTQGVLYCFPPCAYSLDLLRREAPDLGDDGKDEFLVVVVVSGNPST